MKNDTISPYMKAGGCPLPSLSDRGGIWSAPVPMPKIPKKKAPKPQGNRFLKFNRADLKLLKVGLPTAALTAEIDAAIAYQDATEYQPKTFTFRKFLSGKEYEFVIQAPLKSYVIAMFPNLKDTVLRVTNDSVLKHAAAMKPLTLFYCQLDARKPKYFAPVGLDIAGSIR